MCDYLWKSFFFMIFILCFAALLFGGSFTETSPARKEMGLLCLHNNVNEYKAA